MTSILRLGCLLAVTWLAMSSDITHADSVSSQGEPSKAVPSTVQNAPRPSSKVGIAGQIQELVIPGKQLRARPIEDDMTPLIVRIINVFAHGSDWRYNIEFVGLNPGTYALRDYLETVDGSPVTMSDALKIDILSGFESEGQIDPNELTPTELPRVGGYELIKNIVIALWILVFAWLLFGGRKKRKLLAEQARPRTLADYLKPRLEAALAGQLNQSQYAELERMLTSFWRQRLKLESVPVDEAIVQMKQDEQAGPLLRTLERSMHDPSFREQTNLAELLRPLESIEIDDPSELESSEATG